MVCDTQWAAKKHNLRTFNPLMNNLYLVFLQQYVSAKRYINVPWSYQLILYVHFTGLLRKQFALVLFIHLITNLIKTWRRNVNLFFSLFLEDRWPLKDLLLYVGQPRVQDSLENNPNPIRDFIKLITLKPTELIKRFIPHVVKGFCTWNYTCNDEKTSNYLLCPLRSCKGEAKTSGRSERT